MTDHLSRSETSPRRKDHELIVEVDTGMGDVARVWRVTFPDSHPVRLEVMDDSGGTAEVWLTDSQSRALGRALEVIQ